MQTGDYRRIQEHEIPQFVQNQLAFAIDVLEDIYNGLNKIFPLAVGNSSLSVLLEPRLQKVYRKRSEVSYEDDGNKQAQGTWYDVYYILPLFDNKNDDLFFDVYHGNACACVFIHCECSTRDRDQKVKSGSITVSVSPLIPQEQNLKYNHRRIDYVNHIHSWKLSSENWLFLADYIDTIKRQYELNTLLRHHGIVKD